jgi:hypothetical protein
LLLDSAVDRDSNAVESAEFVPPAVDIAPAAEAFDAPPVLLTCDKIPEKALCAALKLPLARSCCNL